MNTFAHLLGYLIDLAAALLGSILLLRAWVFVQAIPTTDPISRFCQGLTNWLVQPIQRSLQGRRSRWDLASLIAAFGIAIISSIFSRILFGVPLSLLGLVITPFALLLRWATELVLWGTVIWALLSWFRTSPLLRQTLGYLVDPFLRPARKILPPFRGFDLSPILVFVLCQVVLIFITPLTHGIV